MEKLKGKKLIILILGIVVVVIEEIIRNLA
jgi:hypothetical protein